VYRVGTFDFKTRRCRETKEHGAAPISGHAARKGTTMSDLILGELPRVAHRPSPPQLLERIRERPPVGGLAAADVITQERERH
jgi:hypothetical protein